MFQVLCPSCNRNLQVHEERFPLHLKEVKGRCPHCREEIRFANPRLKESDLSTACPEVALFPVIPKLNHRTLGLRYTLQEGLNTLGRKGHVSLHSDEYVSRIHCAVEVQKWPKGYRLVLADDGSASPTGQPSRNGTFLNGERLGPWDKMLLLPGDIIRLGHSELIVSD